MFITQNSVLICVNKSIPSWLNFLVSSTRKRVSGGNLWLSIYVINCVKKREDWNRAGNGIYTTVFNMTSQMSQSSVIKSRPSNRLFVYLTNVMEEVYPLLIPAGAIDCLRFNIIILCSLVRSFCFDTVPSGTHRLHSFCFACIYYCILGRTVLLPQIAGSYKISSSSLHFVEVFRSQLFAASVTTSISTRIWPKLMKQYILQMVVQQATEESRSFNDDCTMKIQL
uniref:AlNc14C49G3913 protein n=1 Tax=Albugo laibachii Nc14 TaxID=890382 RepID=F0WB58_9STRA|nr:AlNc14C49G3913 [Albugo laibachii Nc14]|eukprot:CCA18381.1 AlNc14C49G3913 [Albugo laibachii Nc14]